MAADSGAIDRWIDAQHREQSRQEAAQQQALEAKLAATAADPALTDTQAIKAIAQDAFVFPWTLESVIVDDEHNVRMVLYGRDSQRLSQIGDSKLPEALKIIETGNLAGVTSLFAKYAQERELGSISVLLMSEVYVNDTDREFMELYEFTVSADELVKFHDEHKGDSIIMLDEDNLPWTVTQDNYDQLRFETKRR